MSRQSPLNRVSPNHSNSNRVNIPPSGKTNTRPKEKRISPSKKAENGPSLNINGSANSQGIPSNLGSEPMKTGTSTIDDSLSPCTIIAPPTPISNFPDKANEIEFFKSKNTANTFLDSLLNL